MTSDSSSVFNCMDCRKVFEKRMDYNRHRKRHEKPYPCYLCDKKFSLKTGLERHKSIHQTTAVKFRCKIPGCKPLITARKDYLWNHMRQVHRGQYNDNDLRKLHNEAVSTAEVSNADEQGLELLWASREGDEERVRLLISQRTSTKTADDQGLTALHLACKSGNIAVVDLLLENGANPNVESGSSISSLAGASQEGYTSLVKLLLDNGANPDCQYFPETSLGYASRLGMIPMMELLLAHGADVDGGNSFRSPLEGAASAGKLESVKILLDHGADLKGKWRGPLFYAVTYRHLDVVKFLLERGADPMEISDSRAVFSVDRLRRGGTSEQYLQLLEEAHSKNLVREGANSPETSP